MMMNPRGGRSAAIAGLVVACSLLANGGSAAQGAGDILFKPGVVNERPTEPDFALAQFGKLRDYLNSRLQPAGIRLAPLVIARDVPEMADKLKAQDVDAVIEGVFPTLAIERRTDRLQPTLLVWRQGNRAMW